MRHWLGERLRYLADRIDDDGAPRYMGYSFTFERGIGIAFRQDGAVNREDQKGCPLMYRDNEPPEYFWKKSSGYWATFGENDSFHWSQISLPAQVIRLGTP